MNIGDSSIRLECRNGAVTAPHHLAASAGAEVLHDGGNAIEAMVAAAATIAVVYPHMNGIGGDGFWLIHEPGKAPTAIRACGPAALAADCGYYKERGFDVIPSRGPAAALTVAGAIGGWQAALDVARGWGASLPLVRLLEPAIAYASDGVAVTQSQASLTAEKWDELRGMPGFTDVFAPNGVPEAGHVQKQPKLASTLRRLAEAGLDDFYRGDIARSMTRDLSALGSPLALADLEAYHATCVEPLRVSLSVGDVFNHPPPTQGVSALMILGIFDRLGVEKADGFEHIHGLVEATKRAFIWRNRYLGDPAHMREAPSSVLTSASLDANAKAVDPSRAAPWPMPASPGDTVWLGAADTEGRVVSYIQSVYWEFGSGVILGESGVQWQNRGCSFTLGPGPNQLTPARLPFHTLNPALARLRDGRVVAYGTMGGEGQPQTQAAIFTRAFMFGQDPADAISAPRWLLGRTWGADTTNLKIESRFERSVCDALRKAGHDLEVVGAFDQMMGHAGMVEVSSGGVFRAASDPRSDGGCAGPEG